MNLNDFREKIDEIDEQILKLFIERMDTAEKIAKFKYENDLPVLNSSREDEILEKVKKNAGEYGIQAQELFKSLMKISRDFQANKYSLN